MKQEHTNPGALTDFAAWELEAYADGVEIPHLARFFAEQPAVAAAWQHEQQVLVKLRTALYRFDCPTPEIIQNYHWQELDQAEQTAVQAHLQICPHCAEELVRLRAFLTPDQPRVALQPKPVEASGGWQAQIQAALAHLRIVVATLVTPPTAQFAGVALRGDAGVSSSDTATQSFLFDAAETDISLLIQKEAGGTFCVAGQLLSINPTPKNAIKLIPQTPDIGPYTTQADATGNFVIPQLRPGFYQLQIALDGTLIIAPTLQI